MVPPELLVDLGRLDPAVDQNAVGVTEVDEAPVVIRPLGVLVPAADMQHADTGRRPSWDELLDTHGVPVPGVEVHLELLATDQRGEREEVLDVVHQIREAGVAARAGRVKAGAEEDEAPASVAPPDHHGHLGDLVGGEDLIVVRGFELIHDLARLPVQGLVREEMVPHPLDEGGRLEELDAQRGGQTVAKVGDQVAAAVHERLERLDLFGGERLGDRVRDDDEIMVTCVDGQIRRQRHSFDRDVERLEWRREARLVVRSAAGGLRIVEKERIDRSVRLLALREPGQQGAGAVLRLLPKRHRLLPVLARFSDVDPPGRELHIAQHLTVHAGGRHLAPHDLPVAVEPRLPQVLVRQGQLDRRTSARDGAVVHQDRVRHFADVDERVPQSTDAVHEMSEELDLHERVEERRREAVSHRKVGFRERGQLVDRLLLLCGLRIERNVAEVLGQYPLPVHVALDDVGEVLTVVEVVEYEALLHRGREVLADDGVVECGSAVVWGLPHQGVDSVLDALHDAVAQPARHELLRVHG